VRYFFIARNCRAAAAVALNIIRVLDERAMTYPCWKLSFKSACAVVLRPRGPSPVLLLLEFAICALKPPVG
jgi:hypothetical protein